MTLIESQRSIIARLARVDANQLTIIEALDQTPSNAATLVIGAVETYLPLAGMIDLEAERARLLRELEAARAEAVRREARLSTPGFVDKAPAAVVQRERDGLAAVRETIARLQDRLAQQGLYP